MSNEATEARAELPGWYANLPVIDDATQTVRLSDGSVWTQLEIQLRPSLFTEACLLASRRMTGGHNLSQ